MRMKEAHTNTVSAPERVVADVAVAVRSAPADQLSVHLLVDGGVDAQKHLPDASA